MSEFRKKLQQTTNPAVHNRRDASTVAIVSKSDEINNVCSIEFIDKDGYKSNKDNVPVKIIIPGFIGWFPKVGDYVNIDVSEGVIMITSINEHGYGTAIRSKNQTKHDIYTTSFGGTIGGNIF